LQTRRFLYTLQTYLLEIQKMLVLLHREANERPAPFVDHAGVLRDSKTGRAINGYVSNGSDSDDEEDFISMSASALLSIFRFFTRFVAGYSFFGSGDAELMSTRKRSKYSNVG
jgi:carnitine O-acetyltransferase